MQINIINEIIIIIETIERELISFLFSWILIFFFLSFSTEIREIQTSFHQLNSFQR